MSEYDYLIGEAPSDKDKAAELAAALRRRRSYGELGMLTGDRVLSQLGGRLAGSADRYAEQVQDTRQKGIDNRQTEAYQTGQLRHMDDTMRQAAEIARMHDATARRGQDLSYEAALARAAAQAAKSAQKKPSKLGYADRTKLESLSALRMGAHGALNTFQDDYTQTAAPGVVPELGQSRLVNTMASLGAGTRKQKEAADWWSNWNLLYTLPQRNQTFGATLTPTEKQAWFNSDVNPSMNSDQIRSRMKTILDIIDRKAALTDRSYRMQFDPEVIESYGLMDGNSAQIPDVTNSGGSSRGGGAPSSPAAQPPAAIPGSAPPPPKRVRVDFEGNAIGN